MGKLIVHLLTHPIDLVMDRHGDVALAGPLYPVHFVREHGQRCLETVREVGGLGHGALNGLVAFVEQPVAIVDERLNFRRIGAVEPVVAAPPESGQPVAQGPDARESAPNLQEPRDHEQHRDSGHDEPVGERPMDTDRGGGMVVDGVGQRHAHKNKQADRPEHGATEQTAAKGVATHDRGGGERRYPSPRTVSMNEAPSFRAASR